MPELPEVETVVRGLREPLIGRTIVGAKVFWPRSVIPPDPSVFASRLTGQVVASVERRGKWIAFALSGGDSLLIHLRMTGRLALESGVRLDDRHLRVLLHLDDGQNLSFFDQRKFGRLWLTGNPNQVLGHLGPEPLADDFTPAQLERMLSHRRARIKPLLLNQRFIAGLGNIYADEALWQARIHPLRRADGLTTAETRRLHRAIQSVLWSAITSGGTTLADEAYQQPDGRAGEFVDQLAAYGRAGCPCPRCGSTIERITVSQRGTHLCPRCQTPIG
jgi:formamidopyrimidine-DNA glycosylase